MAENWVFLGDSLTEGIGSSRFGYVSEMAELIDKNTSVKVIKLCNPSLQELNAALGQHQTAVNGDQIYFWNLACEGTTIGDDLQWEAVIEQLKPEYLFVMRGALEGIIRPFQSLGHAPRWLPTSLQHYAALDPRCYFSTTRWRRIKQKAVDWLKQRLRLRWLARGYSGQLLDEEQFAIQARNILPTLSAAAHTKFLLALTPVSGKTFPNSDVAFVRRNKFLESYARESNWQYIDLSPEFDPGDQVHYYRDGFHMTRMGARKFARALLVVLDNKATNGILN